MRSNLMPLLKVSLKQSLDFRNKNKKNISFYTPILLILILGSLVSGFYAYMFCDVAKLMNVNLIYILYAMAGIGSLLCVTTTLTKVKSTLFGGNDYDLLASLPIKKSHIVFVKFISLYIVELMYSFIFVLPPTIVILINGCSVLCLIDAAILLFLLPMIPLFVSGIFGVLIGFLSDRFRFGNLITIILYLGLLGAIMYMSIVLNQQTASEADMARFFKNFCWYNPTLMLLRSLPKGINYLSFVGVSLFALIVMLMIMAFCYDYFHFLLTSTKSHRVYVEKKAKIKGQFKAVFFMDLKRYFSSKMYLMNTITGGVLSVLMSVVMIISFKSAGEAEQMDWILKIVCPYFLLFPLWCVGIATPSAVAINFEGKNFWMAKSLPIHYKNYTLSKILLSELVLAPFLLISSGILIFFSEISFINIFMIILIPQVYLFAMVCIGIFINVRCYKLIWSNEMEAVKNSKSMILAMLVDFGFTIIASGLMLGLGIPFGFLVGSIPTLAFVSIIAVTFAVLVQKSCCAKMTAIEI